MKLNFVVENGYVLCGGETLSENFFIELESEDAGKFMTFFPAQKNAIPFTCRVMVSGGKLKTQGGVSVLEISDSEFKLTFSPEKTLPYSPPKPILQESQVYLGVSHMVTLYKDTEMRLLCESAVASETYDVPELTSPQLFVKTSSFGIIVILAGRLESGEYLKIVTFTDRYNEIFERAAAKFSFSDNSFSALTKYDDTLKREKTEKFVFEGQTLKLVDTTFKYDEFRRYPPEKLPRLFMEATYAGDLDKLSRYVTPAISENLSSLLEFIGEFKYIAPEYSDDDLTVPVVKASGGRDKVHYYRFELADNKIDNIYL